MVWLFSITGILRETDIEMAYGNFVLSGKDSPYRTQNFSYNPNDFDRLVEVHRYNVINNKEQIMKALRTALDRRKHKM